jgi:hypothetical protein
MTRIPGLEQRIFGEQPAACCCFDTKTSANNGATSTTWNMLRDLLRTLLHTQTASYRKQLRMCPVKAPAPLPHLGYYDDLRINPCGGG